jgi:hypothetical protein
MESYIDKLAKDYNCGHITRHSPMDVKVLKLKLCHLEDICEDHALYRYQLVIGCLLYPVLQLRVDISFHIGYLA